MKRTLLILVLIGIACLTVRAANEITAAVTLTATKGYLSIQRAISAQWDLTNAYPNVGGQTQTIGTNWEAVTVGDVTTKGWAWFRNLSTNNTISIGVLCATDTNYVEFIRMKPGRYGLMTLGTNGIYAVTTISGTNETTGSVLEKVILDE